MFGRLCHGQDHKKMQAPFETWSKNQCKGRVMSKRSSPWQEDKEVSSAFEAWTNCQKKP